MVVSMSENGGLHAEFRQSSNGRGETGVKFKASRLWRDGPHGYRGDSNSTPNASIPEKTGLKSLHERRRFEVARVDVISHGRCVGSGSHQPFIVPEVARRTKMLMHY